LSDNPANLPLAGVVVQEAGIAQLLSLCLASPAKAEGRVMAKNLPFEILLGIDR
jgi:hypothetical protein